MNHSQEVEIPAGSFVMGRRERDIFATEAERPARTVYLSAFAIDVHPVSNLRYRRFLEANGYDRSEFWSREGWVWLQQTVPGAPRSMDQADLAGDDQPACGLSWYEAEAFAAFEGRRLPTSAEWERAARGLDARLFPWGDEPLPGSTRCNFDSKLGRTSPLGSYPEGVSPCGLHDMSGNVNNWVEDAYWPEFGRWCARGGHLTDPVLSGALLSELAQNPAWAEFLEASPVQRMDRGGGFLTAFDCFEVLSTTRPLGWDPGSREIWHGLRTARSLE